VLYEGEASRRNSHNVAANDSGIFRLLILDETNLDEFTRVRKERAWSQFAGRVVELFAQHHGRTHYCFDELWAWFMDLGRKARRVN
jgi:hypothetical protein